VCGIVGYVGRREAAPILIEGLRHLEYRGYDSFGIATIGKDLVIMKKQGKISEHDSKAHHMPGAIGIGHTRWATHGIPNDVNAHPHTDCQNRIAVVHNGIIENFSSLREDLIHHGHIFRSETDTEVIAHLIEDYYSGDLLEAVGHAVQKLKGSYAFLAVAKDEHRVIAARKASPLVLGRGDEEWFAASDITPLLPYTRRVIYLEDGDIVSIGEDGFRIYQGATRVERPEEEIEWDVASARKGGFDHFMLKEIYEQPDVFYGTVTSMVEDKTIEMMRQCLQLSGLTIVACGTSYHAGLAFKYLMEKWLKIGVSVELASEFKYFTPPVGNLVIAISQSGETADTLAALKKAQQLNASTIAITNVLGSSITRVADRTLYMHAGPEISVAATKSFISQIAILLQIISLLQERMFDEVLLTAHQSIEEVLLLDVSDAVRVCKDAGTIFFVGRGPFYPIALEGALKMKEITYIHAEGYAAGELKHGPFSLLSPETPVVALCMPGSTHAVMLSNIKEIKARGAPVIGIGCVGDRDLEDVVDVALLLPPTHEFVELITSSVVLQLLAYYTARELGRDIDQPRNLAKSVTVE
jgi:glucosamine--fructose-6-phosphate aminotransferase (isomerizing)